MVQVLLYPIKTITWSLLISKRQVSRITSSSTVSTARGSRRPSTFPAAAPRAGGTAQEMRGAGAGSAAEAGKAAREAWNKCLGHWGLPKVSKMEV